MVSSNQLHIPHGSQESISKTLTRTVLFSQIPVSTVEIPNAYKRQSRKKKQKKPQLATESQPKEKMKRETR
jgi:hypothetical protein